MWLIRGLFVAYLGTSRSTFGSFAAYSSLIWEPTAYRLAYSLLIRRYLEANRLSFGLFVAYSMLIWEPTAYRLAYL